MKIKLLLLFLIPMILFGQGSSEATLYRKELNGKISDQRRFELNEKLVGIYRTYNPDSCLLYTEKNLNLIKKNNWENKKGKTLLGLVSYSAEKNKINDDIKFNKESEKLNQKYRDNYSLADNYYMYGRLFHQKADHTNAVANYLKAIDFGKKSKNAHIVSSAYRSLAFLYLDESDEKKAYENIKNSIQSAKTNEDLGFCYGVLAETERSLGKNKDAEKNFKLADHYFKQNQNGYGRAWLLTNWSLLDVSKLDESYKMQQEAQQIWNRISPDHYMSVANHYNIAFSYMDFYLKSSVYKNKAPFPKEKLLDKALEEFKISKEIAKKNNNLQWVMFNYLGMSELSKTKKDLDGYAKNIEEYYSIKDSIYSQERKNELAKLESMKIVEQKNKEIAYNKLVIKNKEREKWLYLLGLGSVLIIVVLLFFLYRQSQKNSNRLTKLNKELETANKTKIKFFGILNHDLRSPVAGLIHFLHLQKEAPELMDEETKTRLENKTIDASERLLQQMEDLLLWSKGQMDNFSPEITEVEVKDIFEDIKNNFSWTENIEFSYDFPEKMKIKTDPEYLKTITRNLTNNAVKVLEEKTDEKKIIWKAFEEKDCSVLTISDNGKGASQEKFKALFDDTVAVGIKKGLGLHLIRDMSKAIGISLQVNSQDGIGSEISLRIKKI
ncbi:HAMP domain-containing sensor histidine kinase [Chryseobacterium sp.]|uniref:HAMP domain-containing sensor histidine kinase n=1 Tax=Chryseobacterium sp. TaxID=1871047 RepID=UPI0028A208EF|nr:HAMP domain-containing sensor histidine kinase [Chryseobacterium sp.]